MREAPRLRIREVDVRECAVKNRLAFRFGNVTATQGRQVVVRARIEGEAQVAFTIQPDGSVRNARLLSSTPPGMFEASALVVAQRWRFEATGRAHDSRRTVHFRLPPEAARDG